MKKFESQFHDSSKLAEDGLLIQGDVGLEISEPIDTTNLRVVENKTLAYGERSGHSHTCSGDVEVFEYEGGMIVVVGSDGGLLEHVKDFQMGVVADHKPLILAPNTQYTYIPQRRYNSFERMAQRVQD